MILLVLLLLVAVVLGGPLALIWACNTLFATAIPFTLTTWFAMFVLWVLIGWSGSSAASARSR